MSDPNRPERDAIEPNHHDADAAPEPRPEMPKEKAAPSPEPVTTDASVEPDAHVVDGPVAQADLELARESAASDEIERAEEPNETDEVIAEPTAETPGGAPSPEERAESETTTWVPSGSNDAGAAAGTGAVAAAVAADDEAAEGRFTWHPEYAGRTVDDVRDELAAEIAADQRQYSIVMEGAEEAEQDALSSIVSLERKWGHYDFGWAELDSDDLASRIVAFEQERERRRELIDWSDYRREPGDAGLTDSGELPPAELSTSLKAISLGLVVLLIVVILLAVWAL